MDNRLIRKLLSFLIFISIISIGLAYVFYDGKITNLQEALLGEKFLLPPTDEEMGIWDLEQHRLKIEEKEREIQYLKNNQEVPLDNGDQVINHFSNYPQGHNPPPEIIQNQINDLKSERNQLVYIAIGISIISTFALWAILLLNKYNIGSRV